MLRPVSPSGSSAAWTSAPTAPSPSWITGMGSFTGLPPPASCAILSDTGVRDRGSSSRPPVSRSAWRRSRAGRHQDATDYGLEPGRKVARIHLGHQRDADRSDLAGPGTYPGIMTFAPGSRASASFGPVTMGDQATMGAAIAAFPDPRKEDFATAVTCGMCRRALSLDGKLLGAAPDTIYRISEIGPDGRAGRSWKRSDIGAGLRTAEEVDALERRPRRRPRRRQAEPRRKAKPGDPPGRHSLPAAGPGDSDSTPRDDCSRW